MQGSSSIPAKGVLIKGGHDDLRKDVRKSELDRIRTELHNVLWGGGRFQGNEIFHFVVKMILAKVQDERETEELRPYGFQILQSPDPQSKGQTLKDESISATISRLNRLYRDAMKNYLNPDSRDIRAMDIRKIGERTIDGGKIRFVVEKFQDISLTENDSDMLGDFFEMLLWGEFKQNRGQFFTHQNIVDFIIHALDLENLFASRKEKGNELPLILDPSCGSGTFLMRVMKAIEHFKCESAENGTERNRSSFMGRNLFGMDFNEDLATATKVNLVMHRGEFASIEANDALSNFSSFFHPEFRKKGVSKVYNRPVNAQFDVIITNPPFSMDLDKHSKRKLAKDFTKTDSGSSENLFIERWYQFLKPYGRVGAVLPESVLDTKENRTFRIFIYKHFWIRAVVSLPYLAFQPFTSTKTSILFLQKKPDDEVRLFAQKWEYYGERFDLLENRFKKILKESTQEGTGQVENRMAAEFRDILSELLVSGLEADDDKTSFMGLKAKYSSILSTGNPFRIERDWWIFSRVSTDLDYPIFMASADEVGYKRLRSTKARPNDLYREAENEKGRNIVIDTKDPGTILDHLRRNVNWNRSPSP